MNLGWSSNGKVSKKNSCCICKTTNQTIKDDSWNTLNFDVVVFGNKDLFDVTKPTRLTCASSGLYIISSSVAQLTNVSGYRGLSIRKNGVDIAITSSYINTENGMYMTVTSIEELAIGDYLEIFYYQRCGSATILSAYNTSIPKFSLTKVG